MPITTIPTKGDRYRFNGLNPHLISYRSMPPHWINVDVIHVDDREVFYRHEGHTKIEQTGIARFMEAAEDIPS